MRLFDFFFLNHPDINQGIKKYKDTDGAVLLDVRTPEEYSEGHIGGSKNLPLQSINETTRIIRNKETPLFVHCLSGGRSRHATELLKQMGYTNVTDIGGIADYRGEVER